MHLHIKKKNQKHQQKKTKEIKKQIKKTGGPVTHSLMTEKKRKRKKRSEIEDALFLSATTIQFYPMKRTFCNV